MPDRALLPRRRPRAAAGTALAVLALALAGCGSDDERRVQLVSYCQPPSAGHPQGTTVQVEFRQGPTVVGRASTPVGGAVTAEVPLGGVQVYADGVQVGSANEGVPTDGPYHAPEPGQGVYLSGEGCPDTPTG